MPVTKQEAVEQVNGENTERALNIYETVIRDYGVKLLDPPQVIDPEKPEDPAQILLTYDFQDIDDFYGAIVRARNQIKLMEENDKLDVTIPEKPPRTTVVVNMFGGPGVGKTTAAMDMATRLMKAGFIVEYAPEVAKEYVWEKGSRRATETERLAAARALNGSYYNQRVLYEEQLKRIQRCLGQCDFVVTDSPILMSNMYLKPETEGQREDFNNMSLHDFGSMRNFNIMVRREREYVPEGRVHTEVEALEIDKQIKEYLQEHDIYFGTYRQNQLGKAAENAIKTHARFEGHDTTLRQMKESVKARKLEAMAEGRKEEKVTFPHPDQFEIRQRDGVLPGETYEYTRSDKALTVEVTIEHDSEWDRWMTTVYMDDGSMGQPEWSISHTLVNESFDEAYQAAYERVHEKTGWLVASSPEKGAPAVTMEALRKSYPDMKVTPSKQEQRGTAERPPDAEVRMESEKKITAAQAR